MKIVSLISRKGTIPVILLTVLTTVLLMGSCKKDNNHEQKANHASAYSSEVLDKWMTLQLRLIRNTSGVPNHGFSRHFAYSGIAALEALAPGITGQAKRWSARWNGLTGLPDASKAVHYYYPASVNCAMAAINRSFFPNAVAADKAAIDSLENALNLEFLQTRPQTEITISSLFGKEVAAAVYSWAETDGYKDAGAPYTVPTGPGLWKPTPPSMATPITPYWGNNRPIITNSTAHTMPAAPPVYSTSTSSPFYQMAKQVYDVSITLTEDQKAMAIFWRDVPGATSPGHWLSILQQVLKQGNIRLDQAALAYALTGSAINDALITCFSAKYYFNLVRPITYIREVMGFGNWNTFIGTPAHPEYPSAHATLSSAAADVLEELFGNPGSFTDHTYDYLGLQPRSYSSFRVIGEESGISRIYAGIHYLPAIQAGWIQGRKVTANIFSKQ